MGAIKEKDKEIEKLKNKNDENKDYIIELEKFKIESEEKEEEIKKLKSIVNEKEENLQDINNIMEDLKGSKDKQIEIINEKINGIEKLKDENNEHKDYIS